MYEQQQVLDNKADAGNENQQAKEEKAKDADRPGIVAARALLATGNATPEDFASLLMHHIFDRNEILGFLHEHKGNAFVDQVMEVASGGSIKTTEAVKQVEAGGPGVEAVKTLLLMDAEPSAFTVAMNRKENAGDWDEMCELIEKEKGAEFLALCIQKPTVDLTHLMMDDDGTVPDDKQQDDGTVQDGPVNQAKPDDGTVDTAVEEKKEKLVEPPETKPVETAPVTTSTTDLGIVEDKSASPEIVETAKAIEGTAEPKQEEQATEAAWVTRARAFNEDHEAEVEAFKKLTGTACVDKEGRLDPNAVANWQVAHGVSPDGRVGRLTLKAAKTQEGGEEAQASETPKKEAGVLVRARELVKQMNAFDVLWEPFVCKDDEVMGVVGRIVDLIRLWHALVDEAGVVVGELDRQGHRDAPERTALAEGLPPLPEMVRISTESVQMARCTWTSVANARDDIWQDYILQRVATTA